LVFAWRRRSLWGIWLIAGLVLLLPSSSVFPAADLAADRRMYLPLLAFAVAAAALLDRVPGRLLICAALLGISLFRTEVWRSDEALWREALARAPEKVRPRIQLARAVAPPEALGLLDEARRLAPNDPAIATEAGRTLLAAGNAAAALSEFGRALALDPHDADNYNNRGVALAALGQTDAARLDFERALALSPGLTSAAENLRRMGGR
jgi:tetratricopeptide (TPR) repeat protein